MVKKVKGLLKSYFIAGLLVILPLALTYWILKALLLGMEHVIGDPIQRYLDVYIPGMGIILLVCLILLVGIFTKNWIGRKLGRLGDKILSRIPLVSNLYSAFKQLVNTVFMKEKANFRGVVMVEFPRRGAYSLAFITGVTKGEVQRITKETMVNLFIPTTPNPTTGFFILVPQEDVIPVNMTVEEGLKMIISGGMVTPPDRTAVPNQQTEAKA